MSFLLLEEHAEILGGNDVLGEHNLAARNLDGSNMEVRYNAVRGLYYKVLTATNAAGPYSDGGNPGQLTFEASVASTNSLSGPQKFFRVSASLAP